MKKSREIMQKSSEQETPSWLRTEPDQEAVQAAQQLLERAPSPQEAMNQFTMRELLSNENLPNLTFNQLAEAQAKARGLDSVEGDGSKTYIFVSSSLSREELRSLLLMSAEPNVVAVLRGVLPGKNFRDTVMALRTVVKEHGEVFMPNLVMDPTLFKRYGITQVPTLVHVTKDQHVLQARGSVSVDWLKRQVERHPDEAFVDLGGYGPTMDIAERDVIELIKERYANMDWEEQKKKSVNHYWNKHMVTVDLPLAREARERQVDPSVMVAKDILGPNGEVLVSAGTKVNPLEVVPLVSTVIVFDAREPEQVAQVRQLADEVAKEGRRAILMTTGINREEGFKGWYKTEQALDSRLYLLNSELIQRFQLEYIPSVITSNGNRLIIREIPTEGSAS
jgi:conjugal transfer pilus assembly protein TraW